jgi:hypothetical protein
LAPGTDAIIFQIFFTKIGVLTQSKAKLCNNVTITLVFEKNANFLPKIVENRRKSLIITSAPRHAVRFFSFGLDSGLERGLELRVGLQQVGGPVEDVEDGENEREEYA